LQAQELWDEFTDKKFQMLHKTSTEYAPWYIIRSDDKHQARRQTIKLILNSVRYRNRNKKLNFKKHEEIIQNSNKLDNRC